MPVTPQKLAGWRIEPPVSVAVAAGARRAAIAAAEPPEEPPGTASVSQGFLTGPNAEFWFEDPMANSSQLSLPRVTMPAAANLSTTVALKGLPELASIFEPAVERQPSVTKISLWAMGMPVKGPALSLAKRASAAFAWASESSASICRKAFKSLAWARAR